MQSFIKNYDKMISFARRIWCSGYFAQADFEADGISKSTYYEMLQKLKAALGDNLCNVTDENCEKKYCIRVDSASARENLLVNIFL